MTVFENRYINLGIIVLVLFGSALLLQQIGAFNSLERNLLDTQFRIFPREDTTDRVVMVSIDEKSLNQFASNRIYWPWPREFYSLAIDYLTRNGADAVVFDILFDTPDFDRINVNGTASDNRFARSLAGSGLGILAMKTTDTEQGGAGRVGTDSLLFPRQVAGPWPELPLQHYLSVPIPVFRDAAYGLGNTSISGDRDGVIRRITHFKKTADGQSVPSLPMATYLKLMPDSTTAAWHLQEGYLRVGDNRIPIHPDGSSLINWYRKGGVVNGTFPYYSFGDVMQSAVAGLRPDGQPLLPDSTFRDKVVFIGASAAGLADIKSTPLSSLEDYPGMEILATSLNNLLARDYLNHPDPWINYALILVLILLLVGINTGYPPIRGSATTLGIFLLLLGAETMLFTGYQFALPLGMLLSIGFLTYTTSLGYRYFTEERDKRQIKSAFNHYVQPELVDEIIKNRDSLKLGGANKELTILFSDLASFTSMSEQMTPEDLVHLMNEYLGEMTDVIFEQDGTIDKFIGDAIMSFWGAPVDQQDHAILACRAALGMNRRLEELNVEWADRNHPSLRARIGINTGKVVVGNIGSKERFNYTAIGDAVNMAARLEPLNNLFGTGILISEDTFRSLKDEFICRQAGRFVVKGRSKAVMVYELLADRMAEDTSGLEDPLRLHRDAMQLFYKREWSSAIAAFEQVLQHFPEDGLSSSYITYCREYMENPPGEEWDGTFKMTHK